MYMDTTNIGTGIGSWTSVDSDQSVAQYAVGSGSGTFVAGTSIIVSQGYLYGKGQNIYSNVSDIFSNVLQLTSNVSNVSNILVITAQRISGSSTFPVFATIGWLEIY